MPKPSLRLLPPNRLVATGPVDHTDWNYKRIVGSIQRIRFRLVLDLLGDIEPSHLLEVGYGSGVFLPELTSHCDCAFGVDVHSHGAEVRDTLFEESVVVRLATGSATALPFRDHTFDGVVAVSALEFADEPEAACHELARVLTDHGVCVVVTPNVSKVGDAGLRVMTGASARADYGDRRERTIAALSSEFRVEASRYFPRWSRPILYRAYRLSRANPARTT